VGDQRNSSMWDTGLRLLLKACPALY